MYKKICLKTILVLSTLVLFTVNSFATATIAVDDETSIDVGLTLQAYFLSSDATNNNADDNLDRVNSFALQRGRLQLRGDTRYIAAFLQTDFFDSVNYNSEDTDSDMRIIDAYIQTKIDPLFNIYLGQHMAPASRLNLTSSTTTMAGERPGINNKSLSWGCRANTAFNTATYTDSDSGLRSDWATRDMGLTFMGVASPLKSLHVKYYLGFYEGIQETNDAGGKKNRKRFTGRLQFNLMDAEENYFNHGTYLGEKETIGIGFTYDMQDYVAYSTTGWTDYRFYSADFFSEIVLGPGSWTLDGGIMFLDLGGANSFVSEKDATSGDPLNPTLEGKSGRYSEGYGYYVQTGYYIKPLKLQPWAMFETWDGNGKDTDKGDFYAWRGGLSYFIKGHNANIKMGLEQLVTKEAIGSSPDDKITSFIFSFNTKY